MKNFSELPLFPKLKTNLARNGFSVPTPVQAMAIEPALAGNNVVATAQTGTGKQLDFVGRKLVSLGTAKIMVLDEADRMLDMGFLPTIKRLLAALPSDHQTLFFSATIESSVKHLVEAYVPNAVPVEVGSTDKPVESVDLHYYEVEQAAKFGLLRSMLQRQEGSFLVFARTKNGVSRL